MKKALFLLAFSLYSLLVISQTVHPETTIIQGSQCTGFDCATNEDFGFDTHRYRESNLRIHFDDDTGNSSSFPKNDWRIIINDSGMNGDEYFSIADASNNDQQIFRLDAGAPENAIYVNSDGKLGLGINTPQKEIHIISDDTPTIRLEQDTNGGFDNYFWDIGGNETNFFLRYYDSLNFEHLPFSLMANAPGNSIFVDSLGQTGIGTKNPLAKMHIEDGDLRVEGKIYSEWDADQASQHMIELMNTNTTVNPDQMPALSVLADGKVGIGISTPAFDLQVAGDVDVTGELTAASDARLKEDIQDLTQVIPLILHLRPVSYQFKYKEFPELNLSERRKMGLIAQEVEEILPTLVSTQKQTRMINGEDCNLKSVNYLEMIPLLIRGLQEQQSIIEKQAQDISALNTSIGLIGDLQAQINELKNQVDNQLGMKQ